MPGGTGCRARSMRWQSEAVRSLQRHRRGRRRRAAPPAATAPAASGCSLRGPCSRRTSCCADPYRGQPRLSLPPPCPPRRCAMPSLPTTLCHLQPRPAPTRPPTASSSLRRSAPPASAPATATCRRRRRRCAGGSRWNGLPCAAGNSCCRGSSVGLAGSGGAARQPSSRAPHPQQQHEHPLC